MRTLWAPPTHPKKQQQWHIYLPVSKHPTPTVTQWIVQCHRDTHRGTLPVQQSFWSRYYGQYLCLLRVFTWPRCMISLLRAKLFCPKGISSYACNWEKIVQLATSYAMVLPSTTFSWKTLETQDTQHFQGHSQVASYFYLYSKASKETTPPVVGKKTWNMFPLYRPHFDSTSMESFIS